MSIKKLLLCFLCVSSLAMAEDRCGTDSCIAKVKKLYPHSNGNVYVQANADMSSLDCTLNQGSFMVLEPTNKSKSEIYSMLLAAMVSETPLVMRIVNGSSNCSLSYTQMNL